MLSQCVDFALKEMGGNSTYWHGLFCDEWDLQTVLKSFQAAASVLQVVAAVLQVVAAVLQAAPL